MTILFKKLSSGNKVGLIVNVQSFFGLFREIFVDMSCELKKFSWIAVKSRETEIVTYERKPPQKYLKILTEVLRFQSFI